MDDEDLLRRTLEDLREAVATRDTYKLILAAGQIRKCLIDGGHSLAIRVNREKGLTLGFEVPELSPLEKLMMEDGATFLSRADGFSPRFSLTSRGYQIVSLDRFLAWPAVFVMGNEVSVRDVVLHVANVAGGVHRGAPRGEIANQLEAVSRELFIGAADAGATTASIRGIADVVMHSLEPLLN